MMIPELEGKATKKRTMYDMKGYTVMKRPSLEQICDSNKTEQETVCEQQKTPEQQEVSERVSKQESMLVQQGLSNEQGSVSVEGSVPSLLSPVLATDDGDSVVMDEEEVIMFDKVNGA